MPGPSLSKIVSVDEARPGGMLAPEGADRLSLRFLLGGPATWLSMIVTVNVCRVWPGRKVSVPDVAA